LSNLISGLSDAGFLKAYAWIASIIVVATVFLTFFDRRFDTSFPKRWRDGVAESFYTVMSVATSGKPPSRKNLFGWVGRIWQGLWLVCGIAVLAYVTSSVTSVMTTLSLTNQINGIADLADQPVGVLRGTVEEDFALQQGLQTRPYPGLAQAVESLLSGDVAAVIADAPVLEYYGLHSGRSAGGCRGTSVRAGQVRLCPPHGSTLTHPLTIEVLGALDTGEVEKLRTRYFGAAE
jgi:ABC-type amino acid transport substrate-binding protein